MGESMCHYIVLLILFFSSLYGMEQGECQFELSTLRVGYRKQLAINNRSQQDVQINVTEPKPCVFCDSEILKKNYIVSEEKIRDVRVMLNKFPYCALNQGIHFLIMPMTHKEKLSDFSQKELADQIKMTQELSKNFYNDSFTQEYFINWGKLAGQSVPHLHSHLKIFKQPCMSLPDRVLYNNNNAVIGIQDVFDSVKAILESPDNSAELSPLPCNTFACTCCVVKCNQKNDAANFVIDRFDHNYICLSHYPCLAGEISVVPYRHVSAMKDLSLDALYENMTLAKVLLVIMQKYADENIRECDGCNMYIKSMGRNASDVQKTTYHLHTRIMPRTTIAPTPGTMDGNSCKLDFEPTHLMDHLKKCNFKELLRG
jgi:diadenosine tetraphosphate (Ap4A) HIT family hydrolase